MIPDLVTRLACAMTGSLTTVRGTEGDRYTPSLLPTDTVVNMDEKEEVGVVLVLVEVGVVLVAVLVLVEVEVAGVVLAVLVLVVAELAPVAAVVAVVVLVLVLTVGESMNKPVINGGTQCTVPSACRIAGTVIGGGESVKGLVTPSPCARPSPCSCPCPCPNTHISATAAFSTASTTVGRLDE